MLCFHMYKPRTNLEYASDQTVYNLQVAELWHAGFHMYKPQAVLVQTSNLWAGPCHQARQDLKENSIFFARGHCRFPPRPRIEL